MLVTAVGVNSQTGIIMSLLGAAKDAVEQERKAAKRGGIYFCASLYTTLFYKLLILILKLSSVVLEHFV